MAAVPSPRTTPPKLQQQEGRVMGRQLWKEPRPTRPAVIFWKVCMGKQAARLLPERSTITVSEGRRPVQPAVPPADSRTAVAF